MIDEAGLRIAYFLQTGLFIVKHINLIKSNFYEQST